MKKIGISIFCIVLYVLNIKAQESLLDNPVTLEKIKQCLSDTYNFSFREAGHLQQQLAASHPHHPAPDFLKGLIIYWENFPLTPAQLSSANFVNSMDRAIIKAERMTGDPALYLEGTFFNLFGRAFKAMYWADNGKMLKVLPDLRTMYANTIKGFDLKDDFVEFYFSTGLYNYYIEAFPEAYPIYKPIVSFMKRGNRELGLLQLSYAIKNSIYLKAESLLFMSLIQLNYENDLSAASYYALQLYNMYPKNSYYWGHSIIILLHRGHFSEVNDLLQKRNIRNDPFRLMIEQLATAFIEEYTAGRLEIALSLYNQGLEIADGYGNFGNLYKAMAYAGLSRIAGRENDENLRMKYLRLAESHTGYKYITSGLQDTSW